MSIVYNLCHFVLLGSACLFQLENVLLGVGEKHLEENNDLSSKVDVEVCFYPHLGSAQTTCAFSFETILLLISRKNITPFGCTGWCI